MPGWESYDNTGKLTPFFENSVIRELIEKGSHKDADYFGVFSHDITKEVVFKHNGQRLNPFSLDSCLATGSDIYSFQARRNQPNILTQAERYHPGFMGYVQEIFSAIGWEIPPKTDFIILFNHFVARSEIYERYVQELLTPAMDVMTTMPALMKNAGYKKYVSDEMKRAGLNHYPFHPFICERLPSVWVQKYKKDLKLEHVF